MNTIATGKRNRRRIIAQRTLDAIAARYGVQVDGLTGKGRRKPYAEARQMAQFAMFAEGLEYRHIAEVFGADRSTVNHNIHAVARRLIQGDVKC